MAKKTLREKDVSSKTSLNIAQNENKDNGLTDIGKDSLLASNNNKKNDIEENIVFEQHSDGSYSVKNTKGEKLYSDDVISFQRDETKIVKKQLKKIKKEKNKTEKELSKKEKQKLYEKKTFAQKMKTLAILLFLGIFTGSGLGVWYFNVALKSQVDYDSLNPNDYIQNLDEVFLKNFNITTDYDKPNWMKIASSLGVTPSDLSIADNFALAEYNAQMAESYIGSGDGKVNTLGITQAVYSTKRHQGNRYTFESISDGMVSVALCDSYIKGNNTIEIYKGSILSNKGDATWAFDQNMLTSDYLNEVGNLPSAIQPYIISDKTILSSSEMTYEENNGLGYYTFSVELDPITSVLNYVRQVKRTGGLGALPEFQSVKQTITIDENWNIVRIDVEEKYSAVAFGMKVSCSGTLRMDYTFNCDVIFPV